MFCSCKASCSSWLTGSWSPLRSLLSVHVLPCTCAQTSRALGICRSLLRPTASVSLFRFPCYIFGLSEYGFLHLQMLDLMGITSWGSWDVGLPWLIALGLPLFWPFPWAWWFSYSLNLASPSGSRTAGTLGLRNPGLTTLPLCSVDDKQKTLAKISWDAAVLTRF